MSTKVAYPNIPTKQKSITRTELPTRITLDSYLGLLFSSSTYIMGILTWYIYAYIIKGKLEINPFYVNLKGSILFNLSAIDEI